MDTVIKEGLTNIEKSTNSRYSLKMLRSCQIWNFEKRRRTDGKAITLENVRGKVENVDFLRGKKLENLDY